MKSLNRLLVADTWEFICMKDVSHELAGHGLDDPSVPSVCADSQSPSGREGSQEVSAQRRVRAELRLHCTSLCPFGA